MNDALLKGLTERSAERRCARLRFERQRLTCIRSLYFKLGVMANASAPCRAEKGSSISCGGSNVWRGFGTGYEAIHPRVPVRLGSRSKATAAGGSIECAKVKVMAFEEHAKPRSYTS